MAKDAGQQELYAELLELRELLMEQADSNATLTFRDGAWYSDGDAVPYCPCCYEVHKKAIHMKCLYQLEKGLYDSDPAGSGWQWQCHNCKNEIRLSHGK
jgi:hypothetical protein